MSDLSNCPFCGSSNVTDEKNANNWPIIQCADCGACGPCIDIDAAKATTRWNTRAARLPDREAWQPALKFNSEEARDVFVNRLALHARTLLSCFDQGEHQTITPSNELINDLRVASALIKSLKFTHEQEVKP